LKKKKARESIRRDLEKYLMYSFKEEYMQKSQEINAKYTVDRGKIFRSIMENEYQGALDISDKELRRLLEKVGIVIYRRASPREKPFIIIFTDLAGKKTAIDDAEEESKVLKRIFKEIVTVFAAVDKEPERVNPKRYKKLDYIAISDSLEGVWELIDENVIKEKIPESKLVE